MSNCWKSHVAAHLLEFDLRTIVFQFIAIFPPGIEIDEGFCVPDTCTTRDTFSLVYVSKYLSHMSRDM